MSVLAEREASSTQVPEGEGVELRRTADGKGDGVMATRPFAAGETVMVGFLVGALTGNDSHGHRWVPTAGRSTAALVQRSTTPATPTAVSVSTTRPQLRCPSQQRQVFDFVAGQPIAAGQELTFDYAMRNFTIDHLPAVCLCGAARCRGSVGSATFTTGVSVLIMKVEKHIAASVHQGRFSTVIAARRRRVP